MCSIFYGRPKIVIVLYFLWTEGVLFLAYYSVDLIYFAKNHLIVINFFSSNTLESRKKESATTISTVNIILKNNKLELIAMF